MGYTIQRYVKKSSTGDYLGYYYSVEKHQVHENVDTQRWNQLKNSTPPNLFHYTMMTNVKVTDEICDRDGRHFAGTVFEVDFPNPFNFMGNNTSWTSATTGQGAGHAPSCDSGVDKEYGLKIGLTGVGGPSLPPCGLDHCAPLTLSGGGGGMEIGEGGMNIPFGYAAGDSQRPWIFDFPYEELPPIPAPPIPPMPEGFDPSLGGGGGNYNRPTGQQLMHQAAMAWNQSVGVSKQIPINELSKFIFIVDDFSAAEYVPGVPHTQMWVIEKSLVRFKPREPKSSDLVGKKHPPMEQMLEAYNYALAAFNKAVPYYSIQPKSSASRPIFMLIEDFNNGGTVDLDSLDQVRGTSAVPAKVTLYSTNLQYYATAVRDNIRIVHPFPPVRIHTKHNAQRIQQEKRGAIGQNPLGNNSGILQIRTKDGRIIEKKNAPSKGRPSHRIQKRTHNRISGSDVLNQIGALIGASTTSTRDKGAGVGGGVVFGRHGSGGEGIPDFPSPPRTSGQPSADSGSGRSIMGGAVIGGGRSSATGKRCRWSPWLNRDTPGGSGDFETVTDFQKAGKMPCRNPVKIDCKTTSGVAWNLTGQVYECSQTQGGICRNSAQKGRKCKDYKVRFCCATRGR